MACFNGVCGVAMARRGIMARRGTIASLYDAMQGVVNAMYIVQVFNS